MPSFASTSAFECLGQRFKITPDIAAKVTAPVLVTNYEGDTFLPGQAQALYDLLRSRKTLVNFTSADGTQFHDAPMAPQRRNEVIFDWLDENVR